jgi:hypothetical protein
MAKHLDRNVDGNYDIIGLDNLLNDNLKVFWTIYLDKKMPWER